MLKYRRLLSVAQVSDFPENLEFSPTANSTGSRPSLTRHIASILDISVACNCTLPARNG